MEYSIHMFSRPISFDLFINKIWCCTSFACIVTPEKEQTTYSIYFKKNRYEDIYIYKVPYVKSITNATGIPL